MGLASFLALRSSTNLCAAMSKGYFLMTNFILFIYLRRSAMLIALLINILSIQLRRSGMSIAG